MHLEGSCHCQRVRFSLESATPVPFMECYCSICRKTGGGGGFAINLGGDATTLKVKGKQYIGVYHARMSDRAGKVTKSKAERHFCTKCGTALWLWTKQWPELIHPLASAIDTPLPAAPERMRLMLAYKPKWVLVPRDSAKEYGEYPPVSLEEWHRQNGLFDAPTQAEHKAAKGKAAGSKAVSKKKAPAKKKAEAKKKKAKRATS